jgi:RNAse (barnase) inhibitor barstar
MKSLYSIVLLIGVTQIALAQDRPLQRGNTHFFLGFNLPLVKVRDQAFSPQIYRGLNPSLQLGYERIGEDIVSRLSFSISYGAIRPKPRPKPDKQLSNADINIFEVSYAYYKRLNAAYTEGGLNRYLGVSLSFTFDGRAYNLPSNNLFGFQANTAINFGGLLRKKLNDNWVFDYEAFSPVLSYAMRPNYVGMMPLQSGDFTAKKIVGSGQFTTVHKLFRFYNRFNFDQTINDHRRRRLAYVWDLTINQVARPLTMVSSGLTYESIFKM